MEILDMQKNNFIQLTDVEINKINAGATDLRCLIGGTAVMIFGTAIAGCIGGPAAALATWTAGAQIAAQGID